MGSNLGAPRLIPSMAGHFVSWKTTEQVELQCPDLLTQWTTMFSGAQGVHLGTVIANSKGIGGELNMLTIEEAWNLALQYATPSNDIAEFILAFTAGQTIEETNSTAKPAELVHLLEFAGAVRGLAGIELFKRRKGGRSKVSETAHWSGRKGQGIQCGHHQNH